ncbi:hypothetical protein CQA70_29050, partial [Klebsiella pneumoniae]
LLAELGETRTVISPALPVNGRTVYQGYLFVGEQLLNESGMRHQPENSLLPGGNGRQPVAGGPALAAGPGCQQFLFQVLFHFRQHRAGNIGPVLDAPAGRAG